MYNATIICPYIHEKDIELLQESVGYDLDILALEDTHRVGSDLMYQKLWNMCDTDIIILHADMKIISETWYTDLCDYAEKYKEAGILGCKLLYPPDTANNYFIQSAGGTFLEDGTPTHFGSGIELYSKTTFKQPELDKGQYDKVREVPWTTFGGIYIKRQVLDEVGDYDPRYTWAYNRDVDYCLEARKLGWKIYQVPIPILHFESKDNKILRSQNTRLNNFESSNLQLLKEKWKDTEYLVGFDKEVE